MMNALKNPRRKAVLFKDSSHKLISDLSQLLGESKQNQTKRSKNFKRMKRIPKLASIIKKEVRKQETQ